MNRRLRLLILLLIAATLLGQCKDTYISPYKSPPTGYLVVEGYISGNGPTQFALSRTIPLPGDSAIPMVTGAKLQVEGNDNSTYLLTEQGGGRYGIDTLPLKATATYRLRINTIDGKSYLSDFAAFKPTPVIDSISWTDNALGVQIYANTHDPAGLTRYYQWSYNETWEYNSAENSAYMFQRNPDTVVPRTNQIYNCWKSDASTTLLLGNSAKLSQDVIYDQPLTLVPANSQQIGVMYSILVRQYALTEDGYNFLTLMQKNTESLGTIFDAQPSELKGNIHCLSDPQEPVIGFISAGTIQQQRIFIKRSQLPAWNYYASCPYPDTVVANDKKHLDLFYVQNSFIPVDQFFNTMGVFLGWTSNLSTCVDCTLQGGTNVPPSYWPN